MVHGKSSDTPSVHQTTQISYHLMKQQQKTSYIQKSWQRLPWPVAQAIMIIWIDLTRKFVMDKAW